MMKNFKNKKISSGIGFIIILSLFLLFSIWQYDSFKIISEFLRQYLILFLNEQYLYTFFGVVFGAFIALFAFLGFIVTGKTKNLVENILFNEKFINLSWTADEEYKLWTHVQIFNPEILRFFDWEEIKTLLLPVLFEKDNDGKEKLNFEGEYYKNAFYRFKDIIENFIRFLRVTVSLLFISLISLISLFLIPFFDVHYIIKSAIPLSTIIVFVLSLFALIFATLVVRSLFIGPKKEIEKLKKEIFYNKQNSKTT